MNLHASRVVRIVANAAAVACLVVPTVLVGLYMPVRGSDERDRHAIEDARAIAASTESRTMLALTIAAIARRDDRATLEALVLRTEYLHAIMSAVCKPDGYGWRVKLPSPPPGWPAIDPPDRSGPWASPP